jgi:hypothetical protein
MKRNPEIVVILAVVVWLAAAASVAVAANLVRVQPREITDLLANPGMGWQTFMKFADEDPALAGLPSSTAYFRWYWKDVEPKDGEIVWAKFDELLSRARKAGQQVAFRIMTAGTGRDYDYSPPWLREMGLPGFEYQYANAGAKHWVPDLDDPRVLSHHLRWIEGMGKRYDGHRDLALMDIGSVGLWGEWHMSQTGVNVPKPETRRRIIDAYLTAFRKTPLVMLIGDIEGLKQAKAGGAGWRADCLGDMGGFSKTWCHMKDAYPQNIEKAGIADAWKRGPVALESCWTMQKWAQEGWDIQMIFDWALAQHASYINNKSSRLPEGSRPLVENCLRLLGYRFVVRSVEHPAEVERGKTMEVRVEWENVGVAPCYADYRPALALADANGKRSAITLSDTKVREWLPGKHNLVERITVPVKLAPGEYGLQLAIVDRAASEPVVRLAIAGRRDDGWYPISRLRVR